MPLPAIIAPVAPDVKNLTGALEGVQNAANWPISMTPIVASQETVSIS